MKNLISCRNPANELKAKIYLRAKRADTKGFPLKYSLATTKIPGMLALTWLS